MSHVIYKKPCVYALVLDKNIAQVDALQHIQNVMTELKLTGKRSGSH